MGGYDPKQIAFVKCNVNSGIDLKNVYCIPMIKLFPAKEKYLPLEYYPYDYSNREGYKMFIEQEGSYKLPWRPHSEIPSTVSTLSGTSTSSNESN